MKRRLLLLIVALYGCLAMPNSASGGTWQNTPPNPTNGVEEYNIWTYDQGGFEPFVQSINWPLKNGETRIEHKNCFKLDEPPCNNPKETLFAAVLLPVCEKDNQEWCIEDLQFRRSSLENTESAEFLRYVDMDVISGLEQNGIPRSASRSLWRAKNLFHGGNTDTYAVSVGVMGIKESNKSFTVNDLYGTMYVRIFPYSEISGSKFVRQSRTPAGNYNGIERGCVWSEAGVCGLEEDMDPNAFFSLSLRVSQGVSGWLMGRLSNPSVSVSTFNATQNRLKISGNPVSVPRASITIPKNQASSELNKLMVDVITFNNFKGEDFEYSVISSDNTYPKEVFKAVLNSGFDTAVASTTTWQVSHSWYNQPPSSCLANSSTLLGLVTTNAMTYDGGPLKFENNTFNYEVAGMHFNSDGTVFKGSYDLLLRKSVAKCLYQFNDSPIFATVTIFDGEKEQSIETTSLQEFGEGKDSWLKLNAKGFTFSSPTIRVKLTQKPSNAKPEVTSEIKQKTVVAKVKPAPALTKKSIACVKGKVTKKVTGTNPKCPLGFKKK